MIFGPILVVAGLTGTLVGGYLGDWLNQRRRGTSSQIQSTGAEANDTQPTSYHRALGGSPLLQPTSTPVVLEPPVIPLPPTPQRSWFQRFVSGIVPIFPVPQYCSSGIRRVRNDSLGSSSQRWGYISPQFAAQLSQIRIYILSWGIKCSTYISKYVSYVTYVCQCNCGVIYCFVPLLGLVFYLSYSNKFK